MTSLILLNGPPASGKSTLARRFADERPGTMALDIDVLRGMLGGWADDPVSAGHTARAHALTITREHLRTGHDVVVPQFLGKIEFIVELEQLAASQGVRFVEVVLQMSGHAARVAFEERTAAGAEPTHRDAALLVSQSTSPDPLAEMYADLQVVVEQRPATLFVEVRRGDIEATAARLSEVVR